MEMRLHKQTLHTKDVVKSKKDKSPPPSKNSHSKAEFSTKLHPGTAQKKVVLVKNVHIRVHKVTVIMASERAKMKNIMKEPCRKLFHSTK